MKFAKTVLPMLGLLLSQNALADDGLSGANTAWILTSTALVLMMTIPGLSLFYGGLVRVKNILSVLMQCFAITCMVSLLWVIIGYSLAFSEGGPLLGGFDQILLAGVTEGSMSGDIPESVFVMFQMTFRHHHASTHCGRFRRTNAVFLDVDLLGAVAVGGLRADYPLGMGWRLARRDGSA